MFLVGVSLLYPIYKRNSIKIVFDHVHSSQGILHAPDSLHQSQNISYFIVLGLSCQPIIAALALYDLHIAIL